MDPESEQVKGYDYFRKSVLYNSSDYLYCDHDFWFIHILQYRNFIGIQVNKMKKHNYQISTIENRSAEVIKRTSIVKEIMSAAILTFALGALAMAFALIYFWFKYMSICA